MTADAPPGTPQTTPLAARLARQIRLGGPMRLSDVMAACLTDPQDGYYTTRDPLGAAGDFITAPEISQMFGEMVGLWLAQVWLDAGAPARIALAELGPGRGTLMADILRATRGVPGFHAAADLWLVEASPVLRRAQAGVLDGFGPRWADDVAALPDDMPLFVVANEFFDALPVRQFQRTPTGWAERMVGLDDASGGLAFGLAPGGRDAELDRRFGSVPLGTWVEICPAAEAVTSVLAARIARHGGAVLAIDYGGWDGTGDTVQALANHQPVPILATAGQADITAHVGFRWLAEAARPLAHSHTTQGAFLERLGITARAQALAARADAATLERIVGEHRRLTHPDEMGTLFKVLALTLAGQQPSAGFEPAGAGNGAQPPETEPPE